MDAERGAADLDEGAPVDVYRNLHRPGRVWSVRCRRTGRVVAHVTHLELVDVTFVVQPAGAAAARRDRVRNVHAFLRGSVSHSHTASVTDWTRLSYDPFCTDGFVTADGTPVAGAPRAAVTAHGAFADEPR